MSPDGRPPASPVHHGTFEAERVYMRGDTVTWEDTRWRAAADFRAGLLPPPLVAVDRPGEFWIEVPA